MSGCRKTFSEVWDKKLFDFIVEACRDYERLFEEATGRTPTPAEVAQGINGLRVL
jgi:hypothetical protein